MPQAPSEITPEWLGAALQARHRGSDVDTVRVDPAPVGTNTHAIVHVGYRAAAGAPSTMFAKFPPVEPERRARVLRTGMGEREARFYRDLASHIGLRVPRCHVCELDPADGSFALLIEDLDSSGCTFPDGVTGVGIDYAEAVMLDLAELHVRFEDPAERLRVAPWVRPGSTDSDYGARMLRYGLEHHRDRLDDGFAAVARRYVDHRDELQAAWKDGPVTLLHGDLHCTNMFVDSGRPGYLDWGLTRLGNPMRDVGYFCAMALSIDDRRAHEDRLIRAYLDARAALGGTGLDFEDAWRYHRLHAAYTVVASCQSVLFSSSTPREAQAYSQAFLARSAAVVEDLDALGALDDHAR